MLPDSPTLTSLLAVATPGPWRTAYHGTHEVEAPPNQRIADCGTVGSAEVDARLIALAPALAAEVIRLRANLSATDSSASRIFNRSKIMESQRDEARAEAAGLRAQLAALTNPSPEAQLRRYREARELVENPPKIAYEWTTFYILGRRMWVRFPVGAIDPVAHVRPGPNEDAEKATEDARLTAAGWQLCGAIDAPAVPVQVGDTK